MLYGLEDLFGHGAALLPLGVKQVGAEGRLYHREIA
jgi:hypothetical protein